MLKVKDLVKEQYNFLSHTEFIEKYKFQLQPLKYYRFNRLEMQGLVIGALLFSLALVLRFAHNTAFAPLGLQFARCLYASEYLRCSIINHDQL